MANKPKVNVNIMNRVDIADLITVKAFTPNAFRLDKIDIDIQPVEPNKKVVIDCDALTRYNQIVTQKAQELCRKGLKDYSKLRMFLEEMTLRMCSEWHRNGLLILEELPDGPEDPYAESRKKYSS